MKQIAVILFDLDNTFYQYEPCHQAALKACATRAVQKKFFGSRNIFFRKYKQARREVKKHIHNLSGGHSRVLYFQRMAESALGSLRPSFALEFSSFYWNAFLRRMKLEKGALDCLRYLKRKKIKIAVISDMTTEIQLRKLSKLGLSKFLNCLVTSEEAGREKPNPKMARLALSKLKMKASQACVIGDHRHRDVQLARRIGAVPIWFGRKGAKGPVLKSVLRVKNFKELNSLLNSLL